MDIQKLNELDDDTFARYVMRAVKNRRAHPHWWEMMLHADLIDATCDVITDVVADAQEQDPVAHPGAKSFIWKMQEALDEVGLQRAFLGTD